MDNNEIITYTVDNADIATTVNDERVKVYYKQIRDNAIEPTQGSANAAGYDLYAAIDEPLRILPHTTEKINIGITMALPELTFGAIFARSGLATNQGLRPANCVGVIDSDYRGEIIVALHNDTNQIQMIYPHDRIAQLVVIPYLPVQFEKTESLTDTARGTGGFGSTGA